MYINSCFAHDLFSWSPVFVAQMGAGTEEVFYEEYLVEFSSIHKTMYHTSGFHVNLLRRQILNQT
jgi:hypothetical protein